jgi:hypothetical protein
MTWDIHGRLDLARCPDSNSITIILVYVNALFQRGPNLSRKQVETDQNAFHQCFQLCHDGIVHRSYSE